MKRTEEEKQYLIKRANAIKHTFVNKSFYSAMKYILTCERAIFDDLKAKKLSALTRVNNIQDKIINFIYLGYKVSFGSDINHIVISLEKEGIKYEQYLPLDNAHTTEDNMISVLTFLHNKFQ